MAETAPASFASVPEVSLLPRFAAQAADYARAASAASTRRAYRADWTDFEAWCGAAHLVALPASPATVGGYLADRAGRLSPVTLARRVSAITKVHRLTGHEIDTRHPAIRDVLKGIRREHGKPQQRAAPATTDMIRAMISTCDDSPIGCRDRAMILIGFSGALRRSELVALDIMDISVERAGARIVINRSKTDQEGEGQVIGIVRMASETCPVAALENWLSSLPAGAGRVFRRVDRHGRIGESLSDKAVSLVLKRRAAGAGINPDMISGHSLRAGFATSAASHGVEERVIARQTRHRSMTVLRRYIREGELFHSNASGCVGL